MMNVNFENLVKKCIDKCLKCLLISKCRQKRLNFTLKIDNTKIDRSKLSCLQNTIVKMVAQLTLHQG